MTNEEKGDGARQKSGALECVGGDVIAVRGNNNAVLAPAGDRSHKVKRLNKSSGSQYQRYQVRGAPL